MNVRQKIVAVIEDDKVFSDILCSLLSSVGISPRSFFSAEEFLDSDDVDYDCIISDLRLHGLSGFSLFKKLKESGSVTPFVIISGHADIKLAVSAIKDGVKNIFTKPINNQELIDSLFELFALTAAAAEEESKRNNFVSLYKYLTSRERAVFDFVVQGMTSKEIAYDLDLSRNTVEVHRSNIMKKMEARSLGHLISSAVRYGCG